MSHTAGVPSLENTNRSSADDGFRHARFVTCNLLNRVQALLIQPQPLYGFDEIGRDHHGITAFHREHLIGPGYPIQNRRVLGEQKHQPASRLFRFTHAGISDSAYGQGGYVDQFTAVDKLFQPGNSMTFLIQRPDMLHQTTTIDTPAHHGQHKSVIAQPMP